MLYILSRICVVVITQHLFCSKCLRQVYRIRVNRSERCQPLQTYTRQIPFRFTIPQQLISARSDVHPDFLKLCPTTNPGKAFIHSSTSTHSCQPWIGYYIRIANVDTKNLRIATHYGGAREIIIMPFTYAAPPIEINHYPHEYKCFSTKVLRKHMFNRSRQWGRLTLSATEPVPINLLTQALSSVYYRLLEAVLFLQKSDPDGYLPVEADCQIVSPHPHLLLNAQAQALCQRWQRCQEDPYLQMVERKGGWEVRECGRVAVEGADARE